MTVSLWLAVLVAWHVPALYEAALRTRAVHDLQHVSFMLVGVLVWVLLIDPTRHGRLTVTERIGVAAIVLVAGQLLAHVMVFSYRPFYGVYANEEDRLLGLSPLTDQKLSGGDDGRTSAHRRPLPLLAPDETGWGGRGPPAG